MSERHSGEWPAGLNPAPLTVIPEGNGQPTPVPVVRLVVVVDLAGCYDTYSDVYEDLRQQTRRNVDCDTAIVQLGDDAIRHSLSLPRAIAGVFFLSAKRIEIHVPAGCLFAEHLASEVAREARSMVRDHQAHVLSYRTPG